MSKWIATSVAIARATGVNRCGASSNATPVSTRPVRLCGVVAVSVVGRGARCRTQVEVGSRLDHTVNGEAVGVDQRMAVSGVERQRSSYLERSDEFGSRRRPGYRPGRVGRSRRRSAARRPTGSCRDVRRGRRCGSARLPVSQKVTWTDPGVPASAFRDEPVVAVAATVVPVAAGRQGAADTQRALVATLGRVCGQLGAGHI